MGLGVTPDSNSPDDLCEAISNISKSVQITLLVRVQLLSSIYDNPINVYGTASYEISIKYDGTSATVVSYSTDTFTGSNRGWAIKILDVSVKSVILL